MKNQYIQSTLLAAGLAVLTLAGCSKHDRDVTADKTKDAYQDAKAATKDAYQDTKSALAKGWGNVKDYTYEKRSDFTKQVNAYEKEFEADYSKAKANYSEVEASAARKAAWAEVKNDEANFKEKSKALGNATAETWDAARDNVVAAWDRLQASYAKARAN